MSNLAYAYREREQCELLDGRMVMMAPQATNHHIVAEKISRLWGSFLKGKSCMAFGDGIDVFLTKKDRVVPDMLVVCNRDIIKKMGIHGVPDLIVEVLSPGTAKRDKGYKKDLYERCGVKEYWLVDIAARSVEIYVLTEEGKYTLYNLCSVIEADELEYWSDEEKSEIEYEFSPMLFPEMKLTLAEIFEDAVYN